MQPLTQPVPVNTIEFLKHHDPVEDRPIFYARQLYEECKTIHHSTTPLALRNFGFNTLKEKRIPMKILYNRLSNMFKVSPTLTTHSTVRWFIDYPKNYEMARIDANDSHNRYLDVTKLEIFKESDPFFHLARE